MASGGKAGRFAGCRVPGCPGAGMYTTEDTEDTEEFARFASIRGSILSAIHPQSPIRKSEALAPCTRQTSHPGTPRATGFYSPQDERRSGRCLTS